MTTTPSPDGILIAIRVTPRGGKNALGGIWTDSEGRHSLIARIAAAPVDGAANAALEKLVARTFGVRSRDVSVESGATSRQKRLKIVGNTYNLATIARKLEEQEP